MCPGVDPAMVVMPSVVQWNHKYTLLADTTKTDKRHHVPVVFPSVAAIDQYMVNGIKIADSNEAVAVFGKSKY